ncbi:hypothetical protein NM208_g16591 [Fusarium decemcellulare]|uniref:Uncharacterized protein n=1 Tax=Fusarium decemcellulare TaxID=57161 RepID=A0ACC1RBN2_9HYPO|nr:hypothetical protein NM208_g16591 [Fusarium decemcellulare]
MASPCQAHTTPPATSSRTRPQAPSNDIKASQKGKKRTEPVASLAPRRPDEIEEPESVLPAPKRAPKRIESSDEEDQDSGGDDDDAESVYLSDDGDQEDTTSEEESSDDSDDSVESIPARQLTRRSTGRAAKDASSSSSPYTITQTRSETTHWITTQHPEGNNGAVTRGTRRVQQQTTMHGQNVNPQQQRRSSGNSLRFNMSINVDMSFSGLVTGRNLSFAGGQLSYAWNRRNTQGG